MSIISMLSHSVTGHGEASRKIARKQHREAPIAPEQIFGHGRHGGHTGAPSIALWGVSVGVS